ncbi:hypothetical protein Tco_0287591 [Tanacetum coccineum]
MTELTLEESLSMFMTKIAKRLNENTNLIKELRAFMNFALRNQKASIKALEIQPRVKDEPISASVETDKPSICRIDASQYADELKETDGEKDLEAHYTNAKPLGKALP